MALQVDDATIARLGAQLADPSISLAKRYRILFTLRNIPSDESVRALANGFRDPSALLKHEIAYAMGQMQRRAAVPILIDVINNLDEHPMVRHEAGEALAAIGDPEALPVLKQHLHDKSVEVRQTCEIAVRKMEWSEQDGSLEGTESNPFLSVDPAPPSPLTTVDECKRVLLDESLPLFERYRAMFALRNRNTEEAVEALVCGMRDSSALFKHEIAYVLGQMQNPAVVRAMHRVLATADENPMVRHEAAEALGAIASPECLDILSQFKDDPERVVRESCEVALDMYAYEHSGAFQYADGLVSPPA